MKTKMKKLKKTRLEHHLRQVDLADILGCTTQFYSQIERGINVLSLENAFKLADKFGVSVEELFREDYENEKKYEEEIKQKKYIKK